VAIGDLNLKLTATSLKVVDLGTVMGERSDAVQAAIGLVCTERQRKRSERGGLAYPT